MASAAVRPYVDHSHVEAALRAYPMARVIEMFDGDKFIGVVVREHSGDGEAEYQIETKKGTS